MKIKKIYLLVLFALVVFVGSACQKFLDKKPDKKLVIPSTLKDIQALYDQNSLMNQYGSLVGDASADDYFLPESTFNALSSQYDKELYTWGRDILQSSLNAWSYLYDIVYQANVGLETLRDIVIDDQNEDNWNNLRGSGLFYRSFAFQQLLFSWALAYDSLTSKSDLGIPLRLNSDFNEVSKRASVEESYQQIISDLKIAAVLLPVHPLFVTRPSKGAAYGLLARIYLAMRNYPQAKLYADSCINIYGDNLLDYNMLSSSKTYPISAFNNEIIFYNATKTTGPLSISYARVDSDLYKMYNEEDLRKELLFKSNPDGLISFRGSYTAKSTYFVGIGLDEIYLIRSECLARLGNFKVAMDDLNKLLGKRYRTGTYFNLTATSPADALSIILVERRKELLFRDLRWMDIKRLNKEGYDITLKRVIGKNEYTLNPGTNRFALPIPLNVIRLTGMTQNPE